MPPHHWTLCDLDDAYGQGYHAGLSEHALHTLPGHLEAVLAASWEAGWRDASEQLRRREVKPDAPMAEPRFPALLQAHLRNDSPRPPLAEADYRLRMQRLAMTPRDVTSLRKRTELTTPSMRRTAGEKKAP